MFFQALSLRSKDDTIHTLQNLLKQKDRELVSLVKDDTTKTLVEQVKEERRVNKTLADSVISLNQMVGTIMARTGVNVPEKSGGTKVLSLAHHILVSQMKDNFSNNQDIPPPAIHTSSGSKSQPQPAVPQPKVPKQPPCTMGSSGSAGQSQPSVPQQHPSQAFKEKEQEDLLDADPREKKQMQNKEEFTKKTRFAHYLSKFSSMTKKDPKHSKKDKVDLFQKCEKCGKNQKAGVEFIKHKSWCSENVQASTKPHVCPEKDCDYRSSSKGGLRTHMDKHKQTKKPCQYCGKLIGRKNLKAHEKKSCKMNPDKAGEEE